LFLVHIWFVFGVNKAVQQIVERLLFLWLLPQTKNPLLKTKLTKGVAQLVQRRWRSWGKVLEELGNGDGEVEHILHTKKTKHFLLFQFQLQLSCTIHIPLYQ
jgi:hypothetical protein